MAVYRATTNPHGEGAKPDLYCSSHLFLQHHLQQLPPSLSSRIQRTRQLDEHTFTQPMNPVISTLEREKPAFVFFVQIVQIVERDPTLLSSLTQHHALVASVGACSEVDKAIRNKTRQARDNRVKPRIVYADLHFIHPLCLVNSSHKDLLSKNLLTKLKKLNTYHPITENTSLHQPEGLNPTR
ncbi:GTPase Der [Striga asiatica]|uniref:GTPase Der n=1 Tax=Striga asiatica TaxID=4170 RepID=A0A5A7PZ56_STRAF|nr:GTPase Der [Striga asiatica]